MKRVVITGLGIYSCLGKTLDEVRDSLYSGKSGIIFDPERKEMGFRSALTAKLEVPDLKSELSRSQRSFMPEQAKYAFWATRDALLQAGIPLPSYPVSEDEYRRLMASCINEGDEEPFCNMHYRSLINRLETVIRVYREAAES